MSGNDVTEMSKDELLRQLRAESESIARRLAQLEGETEPKRGSRTRLLGRSVAACMVICALLFGVSAVAQQQEGLIAFQAGTPARADQINWNFNQLRQWIERKVGNVSDSVVTWNAPDVRFAPSGRGDGGRAFVHGGGDTLILNYDTDFSGGTEAHGNLRVTGGLSVQGNSLENIIDGRINALTDDRIRNWVRGHCRITIGWADFCGPGCFDAPNAVMTSRADGACVNPYPDYPGTFCGHGYSALRYDGDVDANDVSYVRFECD